MKQKKCELSFKKLFGIQLTWLSRRWLSPNWGKQLQAEVQNIKKEEEEEKQLPKINSNPLVRNIKYLWQNLLKSKKHCFEINILCY